MKETIYTIPVNDAFGKDTECPVCELERDLSASNIEFSLGAALMEPSVRVDMNKKGFCREHYSMLYRSEKNALGLSLILTSNHELFIENIDKKAPAMYKNLEKSEKKKTRQKLAQDLAGLLSDTLLTSVNSCFVCDRIKFTMDKYLDVIVYMWKTEKDFRAKFVSSKGFCNKHTLLLIDYGKKGLNADQYSDYIMDIYALFISNWKRNEEDLRWFTKKFDYRFKDEPWKNSKDALKRVIEKNTGYI